MAPGASPADQPGFGVALLAGGIAGVSVDLILFPLDTIKTRLQSPQGFNKAGGFRGIYAGVPSAAIGSFPNAAAFFITYEYTKFLLRTDSSSYLVPVTHMLAACAGEVVACLIRVPSEVVKQRAQVSAASGTFHIFSNILYQEGIQGLYRGYKSTVLREVPSCGTKQNTSNPCLMPVLQILKDSCVVQLKSCLLQVPSGNKNINSISLIVLIGLLRPLSKVSVSILKRGAQN
ncbi:S-adenosylmethionine mitochondrial carrier protein isoform X2 [Vombatus ursinus]|uniref:S-adenosylmethionine mitochondrial carrier protein isoform X2 n=1 Tax=Vombatus ursinus TaxID=29139 RepID=UPI000FFD050C|nr:S-adenosylmethionine mitochondrial carrier protein isoform X2 [Vombatus ursinus]